MENARTWENWLTKIVDVDVNIVNIFHNNEKI